MGVARFMLRVGWDVGTGLAGAGLGYVASRTVRNAVLPTEPGGMAAWWLTLAEDIEVTSSAWAER